MGALPAGVVTRLVSHYGPNVEHWLQTAPERIENSAREWDVLISGYHDAGWTSVLAFGHKSDGAAVVLKMIPETDRYFREKDALLHWGGNGACEVLAWNDDQQLLLMRTVAGQIGGASRPIDHARLTAQALPQLHQTPAPSSPAIPSLTDYYRSTILPTIEGGPGTSRRLLGASRVDRAAALARELAEGSTNQVLLHQDLYMENVLFGHDQAVVFIDPHAVTGPPAFDWGFWCAFYIADSGFEERVELCRRFGPGDQSEVMAWAATMAVSRAMYCLRAGFEGAEAMLRILDSAELSSAL